MLEAVGLLKRKNRRHPVGEHPALAGTDKTWRTEGALSFGPALVVFVVWCIPHIATFREREFA